MKVLFVCLGNICRSPTAEIVFSSLAQNRQIEVFPDSAGTGGWHAGEQADPRTRKHAGQRGYQITHLARQFTKKDFDTFDLILAMDERNLRDLRALAQAQHHEEKLFLITDFCQKHKIRGVPDPYTGGPADFEFVLDLLEDACEGLLQKVITLKSLRPS